MEIVELTADRFEPEHRHQFEAVSPSGPHVVIQGSIRTFPSGPPPNGALRGNEDDDEENEFDVRILVGPFWKDVQSVVPKVTIDGFVSFNPDEDDALKWEIRELEWDTIGELGASNDELRIRLKFRVIVRGEHSWITRLGYHVMARGRRLGDGGLNTPGPVKTQG